MYFILIALLLSSAWSQHVLLTWSSPETIKVISPANSLASSQPVHNTNNPNFIKESQWIGIKGMNGWPDRYQAVFQAYFLSDCPGVRPTLLITADDVFTVVLNGATVGTGTNWRHVYNYEITPTCGLNTLRITVTNYYAGSPGALIFKVVQDRTNCYKCNAGAVYNFNTCACQCDTTCNNCNDALKQWMPYPACGCKCKNQLFSNCHPTFQNFNEATCACQCRDILCPSGLQQDPASCQCKCKSAGCATGQRWNYNKCACEAIPCVKTTCTGLRVWNDSSCSCICPSNVACPSSQTFDAASCSCK